MRVSIPSAVSERIAAYIKSPQGSRSRCEPTGNGRLSQAADELRIRFRGTNWSASPRARHQRACRTAHSRRPSCHLTYSPRCSAGKIAFLNDRWCGGQAEETGLDAELQLAVSRLAFDNNSNARFCGEPSAGFPLLHRSRVLVARTLPYFAILNFGAADRRGARGM